MHRKGKGRSGQLSEVVAHRLELLVAHLVLAALAALPCVPDDGAGILVVHVAAAHADRKRWQLFDKVDALQEEHRPFSRLEKTAQRYGGLAHWLLWK